jgi:murein DD-endopeptidase MepM/ murein hydrolase activator NlpD
MPLSAALPQQALDSYTRARTNAVQHQLAALQGHPAGREAALQKEVTELASLFILQMLQAMRRTVPKSSLLQQGFADDLYHSLFDQEVARRVAGRGDLGLTALLMREFRHHDGVTRSTEPRRSVFDVYRQHQPDDPVAWGMPVSGELTSPYGWRPDPFEHHTRFHQGIDIAAPSGSLVRAAASGQVIFSGRRPGYGNLVIIAHPNGYQTYYAHNAENLVTAGDMVSRQQPIARVGATGRVTAPHLHFEMRHAGQPLDPSPFLHGEPHF